MWDDPDTVTPTIPEPLPDNPLPLVERWIAEALASIRNATAMALAAVDPDGRPSARMVICRGFDTEAGWLVFYTDRESAKGRALEAHPRASVVFYWEPLERQIRVDGPVTLAPDSDSDAYWTSRPLEARLAAIASEQSRPIASRAALVAKLEAVTKQFAGEVPRPKRWGGYRVWVERVELWVSQPARLHDRAVWRRRLERAGDGFTGGSWRSTRLQP
jgi:pyridoxamine 5'-phosphate oxidase